MAEYSVPDEILEYLDMNTMTKGTHNVSKGPCLQGYEIGDILKCMEQCTFNLTMMSYTQYFHILLWLEEVASKNKNETIFYDVQINKSENPQLYTMALSDVKAMKLPIYVGSTFSIKYSAEVTQFRNLKITARIRNIEFDTVYFEAKNLCDYHLPGNRFNIKFRFYKTYKKLHMAVEKVAKMFQPLIFPLGAADALETPDLILRYFNPNIETNIEQKKAVTRMVLSSSGTAPFILLGPPGTGKTVTILEAILQLVTQNGSNRILVCSHSNAAVDNIAYLLIKYVEQFNKNLFVRLYSKSNTNIPHDLQPFSKVKTVYASYSILLSTLCNATNYNLNHITHVVIDEAGQATEPSCLLPFSRMNRLPKLILSGDYKQLGPVVISEKAKEFGYDISLMERLKRCNTLYSNETGRYMVMLKNNYRSDKDIIQLPNVLFYDGKLKAMAEVDMLTRKNILSPEGTCRGIVFHAVLSTEHKTSENSYCNIDEYNVIKIYIKKLSMCSVKDKDIAIITPYKSQVTLINNWLMKNNFKIDVETVDAFQGQERRIIIISTVRGMGERTHNVNLGFLSDVKRFNVALTRAKSKVIVIGNPLCLRKSHVWHLYIQQCKNLGTHYGINVEDSESTQELDAIAMLNNLHL